MCDVDVLAQLDDGSALRDWQSMDQEIWQQSCQRICQLFGCCAADIADVQLLTGGRTNVSFAFSVLGVRYVYRHPGPLTETFIDRRAEQFACERASELGVGEEIVFMDAATGVKVSRFIEVVRPFDFANAADIEGGAALLRRLHGACISAEFVFDHLEQIAALKEGLDESSRAQLCALPEVKAVEEMVRRLDVHVKADSWPRCLIHGDPKGPNILVSADRYTLIDWEYAGVKDIGYDISHYAAEIGRARTGGRWELSREDAAWYFGGAVTERQYRHVLACFAIEEFYWTVWAVHKALPDVISRCYENARRFAALALEMYEAE